MRFYFKIASKQDETRSFVVNRSAAAHFFKLGKARHGDSFDVVIKAKNNTFSTKIVVHQDIRILLPLGLVFRGETVLFEYLESNTYKLYILNIPQSQHVSRYMEENHFMTNTDLLCQ
ncbi:MAG TPA: hypothetical protein DCR48_08670 [Flavobacteriales bacterium]|jgi:hypothetical protein|nr:hypothetical protein [Flavobacteriales bacterium]